jgi:hypothetical protein
MCNFTLLFEIVCMKTYFASPFLLVFLSICLTNCQNEPASHAPKVEKKRIDFSDEFKDLVVFEQYVKKIDENKQLQKIQGLFFTDSEGNTNEATAWLDADMNIVKIKQIENLTSGKKYERTFYFCDGLKTVSQQITAHYERKSPYFSEERSYYSTNGSVIATFQRYSKQEDVSLSALSVGEKHACSHQTALDMIKRSGDFETRFLGFDEAFGRKFLVLGTSNQSTTVAFNVESPILKQLKNNEKSYKNKRFDVEFSPITEPDGFTFQALINLSEAKN